MSCIYLVLQSPHAESEYAIYIFVCCIKLENTAFG